MAAKSKAPVKQTKAKVSAKATIVKAKPRGLMLTVAQWAAYHKAYSAAASAARRNIALAGAAKGIRKYRLGAAYSSIKRYNAARASAQAGAVAAYAARQSWRQSRLANQNAALQSRIELDMYNHASLAGRLQYAQGGERGYMNSAVMRTMDIKQSLAYESKVFAKIAKTAKKASKSVLPKTKIPANSAAVTAAASAAGLAAARQIPGKGQATGSSAASLKARATAKASVKTTAAHRAAAKSKKAPVKAAKTRTAPNYGNPYFHDVLPAPPRQAETTRNWAGNEMTPNCIIAAVANHLLHSKGLTATEAEIDGLTKDCGGEPTIEGVLWVIYQSGWPWRMHLSDYQPVTGHLAEGTGLVIGFEVTCDDGSKGDHAALSLPNGKVVSWGSVTERESPVEEAWELTWVS